MRISALAALVAFAFIPHSVSATEPEEALSPTWEKIDPAWDGVSGKVVDLVGEEKQKLLADLAYAAVVADLCTGLPLDRAKFQAAFDDNFKGKEVTARSPADIAQYGQTVAMYFGVYVGLLTAGGLFERQDFCESAQERQAAGDGRFWMAASLPQSRSGQEASGQIGDNLPGR